MFTYTRHALGKMDALGIDKTEIENAVRKGMKWKESDSGKWHAQMAGIEVVFIKQNRNLLIITAYLAGRTK